MAAPTIVDSGSQTAVIDTEHTLTTQTTAGVYVLQLLTANLQTDEIVLVAIKVRETTGGSWYVSYSATFFGGDLDQMKISVPVPVDVAIQCTLKQTSGTGRAFPWKLFAL